MHATLIQKYASESSLTDVSRPVTHVLRINERQAVDFYSWRTLK